MKLTFIDWTIMVIYFVFVLGIGFALKRYMKTSTDFFLSGRSIPAWITYKTAYPEMFPSDSVAYRAYPNNVEDLFRTGMVYENSVGFQGGDSKSSVAATLSNVSHTGYVEGSSYKRSNLGLGAQTKLDMGLTVRGNFSYSKSKQTGGYFGENQVDGAASLFARSMFLFILSDITRRQEALPR